MSDLKIEFPRFKVESYEENGDTIREIHLGNRDYDVTDNPVVWYTVAGLSITTLSLAFAVVLSLIGKVFSFLDSAGVIDGILTVAGYTFQLLIAFVLILVVLGLMKYAVTGSAEPFVSVNIRSSDNNDSTEAEN